MTSKYIPIHVTDQLPELSVIKDRSMNVVRTMEDLKPVPVWMITDECTVESAFSWNEKKAQTEGYAKFALSSNLQAKVGEVYRQVSERVLSEPRFETVNNMHLSPELFKEIFDTPSDNILKVSVSKDFVTLFSPDKQLLDSKVGWANFRYGKRVTCVVEPCYLWFLKDENTGRPRAGLSWILHQVRFLDEVDPNLVSQEEEEEEAFWTLTPDED